jgi:lipoprotein-anchoring transpeptidase ErfK/SrfK
VSHEPGLLRLLNGMSDDTLHAGKTLMVPEQELLLEIDRHGHGLIVWLGDLPLQAYEVGLGKEGRTPSGQFVVQVKQVNPTWYRDGEVVEYGEPENILGTRWMGFENQPGVMGYGIHGTERPDSIGRDQSMGCVRMRNVDVEELFDIVTRGTQVSIP